MLLSGQLIYRCLLIVLLWNIGIDLRAQSSSPDEDAKLSEFINSNRYYVIIGVNAIAGMPSTSLDYAQVDIPQVKEALEGAHFKPLSDQVPLVGPGANLRAVKSILRDIHTLPSGSTVLVYYSGHAFADEQHSELWLQLQDNAILGADGIKISDLLEIAREDDWRGQLAVVIDSCNSGTTAFGHLLLEGDTEILASSDRTEPSRPIKLPDGTSMSAFTYALLLAAGDQFTSANASGDGLLTLNQIATFAKGELGDWKEQQLIDGPMSPRLLSNTNDVIFKFDPTKNRSMRDAPMLKIFRQRLRAVTEQHKSASVFGGAANVAMLSEVQRLASETLPYIPAGSRSRPAVEMLKNGDFVAGLSELRSLEEHSGQKDWGYEIALARVSTSVGLDSDASQTYRAVLASGPDISAGIKLEAASSLIRSLLLNQAENLLHDVAASAQQRHDQRMKVLAADGLGTMYLKSMQPKKAIATYTDAVRWVSKDAEADPLAVKVNSGLAEAFVAAKKYDAAEKQYELVIRAQDHSEVPTDEAIKNLTNYSGVLLTNRKESEAVEVKKSVETLIRTQKEKTGGSIQ